MSRDREQRVATTHLDHILEVADLSASRLKHAQEDSQGQDHFLERTEESHGHTGQSQGQDRKVSCICKERTLSWTEQSHGQSEQLCAQTGQQCVFICASPLQPLWSAQGCMWRLVLTPQMLD